MTAIETTDPNYLLIPLARMVLGLSYPEHFKKWAHLSENEKRLLVIASRDHGKTTFFDRLLPIHRILSNKAYEILLVSYSDAQVMKIGGAIKEIFDSKPTLKAFSPRSEDDWSKSRMKFKDGSIIDTLTFGSSGRGGHYDLILIDDPVKDFGGMNSDDQSQYLTRSVTPMCKPDGQIIITGNYVYDGDLIDRVEKNSAYRTVKYPAINPETGKPLWPEYWSLDKLAARRKEIESSDDPFGFIKEYLLEKIDAKAQYFKRPMFKFYKPYAKPEDGGIPERLSKVASLDPAITTTGDYTAFMITGTDEKNKTYLLDYFRVKTDNLTDIVSRVFKMMKQYDVQYMQVETIGFQKLLKHWFYEGMRERNHFFGIEEITTHKKSKEARIMALQPRIESGSLLFHPSLHEEVINEFITFPRGKNDDMIDALAFQIGRWDNPGAETVQAMAGTFDWWKGQVHADSPNWYKNFQ